ncbi:WecB/TagA/CpsF family glycosyltransferase [Candidatus Sumerlaeota bacterium]|nr:WecB/TagA/CpsF family glycosyltransferase [Candidatus Sumerlaeota bacterium]
MNADQANTSVNPEPRRFPSEDFLGIPLSSPTLDELLGDIVELSYGGRDRARIVTYINAHCVNMFHTHAEYGAILRQADYIYADGMSVVKAARRLGIDVPERLSAAHFFEEFCRRAAQSKRRLFFVGGKRAIVRECVENMQRAMPELDVAGYSHGYFELGLDEEKELAAEIRSKQPDIVIAGMGAPKQELWASRNQEKLHVPVVWCVGAMFEYLSGRRALAPRWLADAGWEWLFRLALEPGRLWRRYLIGNLVFKLHVRKAIKRKRFESLKRGIH